MAHRVELAISAALFEYLTRGLQSACQLLESQLIFLMEGGFEREKLFMFYAKLLYHHSRTRTEYRPAYIRSVLERALASFPDNSLFLSLHAYNVCTATYLDSFVKLAHIHHRSRACAFKTMFAAC